MSVNRTPIALFTFNRPQHTQLALDNLSRCDRYDECEIFIFSDGAKDEKSVNNVELTRAILWTFAQKQKNVSIIERPENWGLAKNITHGVSDLCDSYGRAIVIEDDHQINQYFINYMLSALDRYQDVDQVGQISAYMFPVTHPQKPDAFFLPLMTTWGWATWERVWHKVDWEPKNVREQLSDPEIRYRFDLNDSYPYTKMLLDRLDGKNQSWGILFWWNMFLAGKLALHPRHSLVWVGGFDGTGVHSGNQSIPQVGKMGVQNFEFAQTMTFPDKIEIDRLSFERIKNHLRYNYQPDIKDRVIRKLRKILNKLV